MVLRSSERPQIDHLCYEYSSDERLSSQYYSDLIADLTKPCSLSRSLVSSTLLFPSLYLRILATKKAATAQYLRLH